MSRSSRRPIASFEFGTRIYAPEVGSDRYRVVTYDPSTGKRKYARADSQREARFKAREFERHLLIAGARRFDTTFEDRSVRALADRYVTGHLNGVSIHFRERQEAKLQMWILPHLGELHITDWTPADSQTVLAAAQAAGLAPATVQDIGATMRALVTHARRLRWLTSLSEDPMWMVNYARKATIQGEHALYIPRATLPTDADCAALFEAMAAQGNQR